MLAAAPRRTNSRSLTVGARGHPFTRSPLHPLTPSPAHPFTRTVRGQPLICARLPANDVDLVKRGEATFAGAAWQIGPGFIGAQVGDEVIRRGESCLARGSRQKMALKWRGM